MTEWPRGRDNYECERECDREDESMTKEEKCENTDKINMCDNAENEFTVEPNVYDNVEEGDHNCDMMRSEVGSDNLRTYKQIKK